MFIRVLLPDPDEPISATSSPIGDLQRYAFKHRHIHIADMVGFVDILQFDQVHNRAIARLRALYRTAG